MHRLQHTRTEARKRNVGLYVTIVVMTTHSFDNSDFNAGDDNGASNSIDSNDAEQQALRLSLIHI